MEIVTLEALTNKERNNYCIDQIVGESFENSDPEFYSLKKTASLSFSNFTGPKYCP